MEPTTRAWVETATRRRIAEAGVAISDAAWSALPATARRQLGSHPNATEVDRSALRALARWLLTTFPPGWNAATE